MFIKNKNYTEKYTENKPEKQTFLNINQKIPASLKNSISYADFAN